MTAQEFYGICQSAYGVGGMVLWRRHLWISATSRYLHVPCDVSVGNLPSVTSEILAVIYAWAEIF